MESFSFSFVDQTFPPGLKEALVADQDSERYIIYDNSYEHQQHRCDTPELQKMRGNFCVFLRVCRELSIQTTLSYTNNTYVPFGFETAFKDPAGANMLCCTLLKCAEYIRGKKNTLEKEGRQVRVLLLTRGYAPVDGSLFNVLQTFDDLPVSLTVNIYTKDRFEIGRTRTCSEWESLVFDRPSDAFKFPFEIFIPWEITKRTKIALGTCQGTSVHLTYGYPLHLALQLGAMIPVIKEVNQEEDKEALVSAAKLIYGTSAVDEVLDSQEEIITVPRMFELLAPKLKSAVCVNQSIYSAKQFEWKPWFQVASVEFTPPEPRQHYQHQPLPSLQPPANRWFRLLW